VTTENGKSFIETFFERERQRALFKDALTSFDNSTFLIFLLSCCMLVPNVKGD
jgi:hypothetical protein